MTDPLGSTLGWDLDSGSQALLGRRREQGEEHTPCK